MVVQNFIFLGAPGVGKGTIAERIMAERGIIHISTGDIFRTHIKQQTKLGQSVARILTAGKYVPDKITNAIVASRLAKADVQKHGFILDGYPRTINQANFLKSIMGSTNLKVVLLEAAPAVVFKRLNKRAQEEKRLDDVAQVMTDRIALYNQKTAPLISYYEARKQLVRINVEGSIANNTVAFYKECPLDHD